MEKVLPRGWGLIRPLSVKRWTKWPQGSGRIRCNGLRPNDIATNFNLTLFRIEAEDYIHETTLEREDGYFVN